MATETNIAKLEACMRKSLRVWGIMELLRLGELVLDNLNIQILQIPSSGLIGWSFPQLQRNQENGDILIDGEVVATRQAHPSRDMHVWQTYGYARSLCSALTGHTNLYYHFTTSLTLASLNASGGRSKFALVDLYLPFIDLPKVLVNMVCEYLPQPNVMNAYGSLEGQRDIVRVCRGLSRGEIHNDVRTVVRTIKPDKFIASDGTEYLKSNFPQLTKFCKRLKRHLRQDEERNLDHGLVSMLYKPKRRKIHRTIIH